MESSRWIALFTTTLLACSQEPAAGRIEGEAAPTLQGIVAAPTIDGDSVDVLVFWSFYPGMLENEPPSLMPAERVQVQGSFPSAFKLGAMQPPPEFVLEGSLFGAYGPAESRVAEGYIVAVAPGTSIEEVTFADIVGSDRVHSIAYVESDIEVGSFGDYFLGPLAAGFHLIETKPETRDCEADPDSAAWYQHADGTATCYERVHGPAPLGFDTPLDIEGAWSGTDADGGAVVLPYYLETW